MNLSLPKSLNICGTEYEIRYDYRCILEICAAMEDPDLDNRDKAIVAMVIFYPAFHQMPAEHYEEAIKKCYWFIDGGYDDLEKQKHKLVSWEQDIRFIISPVNRVLGNEVRSIPYDAETNTGGLHWWTFLSAYMEIGDCTFSQIVRIRDLRAKGKKLDRTDQEWYKNNKAIVDFKRKSTTTGDEILKAWGINK